MRIIAGEMRSRTILAPKGSDTRPTLDRTRESLFNILAAECPESRVLDLYAGSGALALEALSRGAASAVLCDCSREAARVIRQNIEALHVGDRAWLLQMRDLQAVELLAREKATFDLVFLDPPYRISTVPACQALDRAGVLAEDALLVIEHAAQSVPEPGPAYALTDLRRYRDTMISFFRYRRQQDAKDLGISGQL
ncbi:MAG: 16S rRNA (guanine(966)-N(2))-methyltransferase RsmD [Clostridia bacterium]|nr:16S rRNA (guanine(966)-N(2))-methyltransferase RsmD [Clostridia bacterium]